MFSTPLRFGSEHPKKRITCQPGNCRFPERGHVCSGTCNGPSRRRRERTLMPSISKPLSYGHLDLSMTKNAKTSTSGSRSAGTRSSQNVGRETASGAHPSSWHSETAWLTPDIYLVISRRSSLRASWPSWLSWLTAGALSIARSRNLLTAQGWGTRRFRRLFVPRNAWGSSRSRSAKSPDTETFPTLFASYLWSGERGLRGVGLKS